MGGWGGEGEGGGRGGEGGWGGRGGDAPSAAWHAAFSGPKGVAERPARELERIPTLRDRPPLPGWDPLHHQSASEGPAAALQAGLGRFVPLEMTKAMATPAKSGAAELVITRSGQNGSENVLINTSARPSTTRWCGARSSSRSITLLREERAPERGGH